MHRINERIVESKYIYSNDTEFIQKAIRINRLEYFKKIHFCVQFQSGNSGEKLLCQIRIQCFSNFKYLFLRMFIFL